MGEAFLWGFVGAASLILGAVVVEFHVPAARTLGLVMGFGAGVLISAVSFELVEEAADTVDAAGPVAFGFLTGAVVFFTGDLLLERQSRRRAKLAGRAAHDPEGGDALGIVLGTVLDGIPESAVLGLTLLQTGSIGVSMLVAVFVSNLPESIAASTSLLAGGWSRRNVLLLWSAVAVASAVAAAGGFVLLDGARPEVIAFVLAFAGGAILCMLTSTMVPEGYEKAGRLTGLVATLGFAIAFFINWAEA